MGPQIQQVSTLRLPTDGLDFLLSLFLGKAIQLFPQKLFLFFVAILRFYAKIAEKGRQVWSIKTCLSTTTKPQTIEWADDVNSLTMQVS